MNIYLLRQEDSAVYRYLLTFIEIGVLRSLMNIYMRGQGLHRQMNINSVGCEYSAL